MIRVDGEQPQRVGGVRGDRHRARRGRRCWRSRWWSVAAGVDAPAGAGRAAAAAAALAALLVVYRLIDAPELPIDATPATPPTRPAAAWARSSGCSARRGSRWGAASWAGAAAAERRAGARPPSRRSPRQPRRPPPASPEPRRRPAAPRPPRASSGRPARRLDARRHRRRVRRGLAPLRPPPRRALRALLRGHPELVGEQRTSARDLAAALPPGWAEPRRRDPRRTPGSAGTCRPSRARRSAVGLLGVAARRDPSLGWLWEALDPLPPAADDEPATRVRARGRRRTLLGERPRQTSLDVLVDDPNVLIGIEVKWREHGIGACLCRGDGRGAARRRALLAPGGGARRLLGRRARAVGLPAREPARPARSAPSYEAVRHAAALRALAGPDRPAVLALALRRREPLLRARRRLARLAAAAGRGGRPSADAGGFRFAAISWQELVPLLPLDDQTRAWAADKHGLD